MVEVQEAAVGGSWPAKNQQALLGAPERPHSGAGCAEASRQASAASVHVPEVRTKRKLTSIWQSHNFIARFPRN